MVCKRQPIEQEHATASTLLVAKVNILLFISTYNTQLLKGPVSPYPQCFHKDV